MITYICKYTPLELLYAFGEEAEGPDMNITELSGSEGIIHGNLCSHAKLLGETILKSDGDVLLTNCCDPVRRVKDSVSGRTKGDVYLIDLPHRTEGYGPELYFRELKSFVEKYSARTGRRFDREKLISEWTENARKWREAEGFQGSFIAVMGARAPEELVRKISEETGYPVRDFTCGGLRQIAFPPENAAGMDDDKLIRAYARAVLQQAPCMRMTDTAGRGAVLTMKGLKGIVYHSIRFCDYYSFEYADIRRSTDLPVLKIETDHTSPGTGQAGTRIAAFAESMGGRPGESMKERPGENIKERSETDMRTADKNGIYVGIDSGSTSTNLAALDGEGRLAAKVVLRTGASAKTAAEKGFRRLKEKLGDRASDIKRIVATGYGREFISFADSTRTEISCHGIGAHFLYPEANTVIDIGGQDSKVICLDGDGNVTNFVMNDKCAAGTGRFLEMMASTLEMPLDRMIREGLLWKKDLDISSVCTVFAESEVVSLIAQDTETADIIHALNKAVAAKTSGMVKRVRGCGPYIMTGGVARNSGVVSEMEKRLSEKIIIPKEPELNGAIGAALCAIEGL